MQSIAACDCATLQIQHRIGNAHGGFTVRDQHHSHVLPLIRILLALGQLMNGTQNDGFIQGIQTTGRLVEEHQVGIAQEYTGQADALAFAFRQSVAQLAHLGVEPIRQGIDQVEHGCLGEGFAESGVKNTGGSPIANLRFRQGDKQILSNRAVEQVGLLTHHGLNTAAGMHIDLR